MYLAFWIGWSLIGLAFTIGVFAWAVRTRQFTQSRRASLIPFDDITPEDQPTDKRFGAGRDGLLLVVITFVVGVLAVAALLVFAITTI